MTMLPRQTWWPPLTKEEQGQAFKRFILEAHDLYRQVFESTLEYKAFWDLPARQQFAILRSKEPVTLANPLWAACAQADAPETAKRMRRYAGLVQEYGRGQPVAGLEG